MAVDIRSDGRRGLGALLRDLAEGSAGLVRGEVRLARLELGAAASAAGRGTAFVAVGGVLLLIGNATGATPVLVAATVGGVSSLVCALIWRAQLIEAWRAEHGRPTRDW